MQSNKLAALRGAIEEALGHSIHDVQLDAVEAMLSENAARIAGLGAPAPVPVATKPRYSITMSGTQLREALEFVNPDGPSDVDQAETEVTITEREAFTSSEGEAMPAGLYVHLAEYPEEGVYGPLGIESLQPA